MSCDNAAEFLGNCDKGFILVVPDCNGLAIAWKALQMGKWRALPITRSENDWNNASIPALVALKGMLHLGNDLAWDINYANSDNKANQTFLNGYNLANMKIAPSYSVSTFADHYNSILLAPTGNAAVDAATPKLKLRQHSKLVRAVTFGRLE